MCYKNLKEIHKMSKVIKKSVCGCCLLKISMCERCGKIQIFLQTLSLINESENFNLFCRDIGLIRIKT